MQPMMTHMLAYAQEEFDGRPYNGPSLMATVGSLDLASVLSRDTHEGWSVWDVVLHLAWYKHQLASDLGVLPTDMAFPWCHPDGKGPLRPETTDAATWEATLAWIRRIHGIFHEGLAAQEPGFQDRTMERWGLPWGRVIAWYLGHDAYHSAQIRNMGLPALRQAFDRP